MFTSTHLEDLYLRLPSFAARQQKWPLPWDQGDQAAAQGHDFGYAEAIPTLDHSLVGIVGHHPELLNFDPETIRLHADRDGMTSECMRPI